MTRDLLPLTITGDAANPAGPPAHDSVAPLYNVAEFARHGLPAVLSTDDGSYGHKGFVTDTLRQYLDRWITDNADRARTVIYACGPEGMLKAVADVARRRQIACQVCVERAMACGLGTCQSCVIKQKKPDPSAPPLAGQDWAYRLACTDGPVFEADTLLW
jgi:dihydroorotate dehydrogenase electron transfer subunit